MTGRRELAPDRIASLFLPQRTIARSKQGGNAIFHAGNREREFFFHRS
jgi:hypothetical protein